MKIRHIGFSMVFAILLSYSCDKKEGAKPTAEKNMEVRIAYNAAYANYHLIMSLKATTMGGELPAGFSYEGITTIPRQGMSPEARIVHGAGFDPIPTSIQSFKTSHPVKTLGVFLYASQLRDTGMSLTATLDFYVDGKKTATANTAFTGPTRDYQGFIIDVNNPGKLIESSFGN